MDALPLAKWQLGLAPAALIKIMDGWSLFLTAVFTALFILCR